ncbi:MAG: 5'/3'-nucleotidase SurE [Phycisphaerae bacterium]
MNIVITNDDGANAPGLRALFHAVRQLGRVHVVAPRTQRSACSHTLTLRTPITCNIIDLDGIGTVHAVDGTPADCVRLANAVLVEDPIDLVVAGNNRGANSGVDTYYSGTVAAAREAAQLGLQAVAVSQAVRGDTEIDWTAAARITRHVVASLAAERLEGPGFWNVNLPLPIPPDAEQRIRRVPVAQDPVPVGFDRVERDGDGAVAFNLRSTPSYWSRDVAGATDFGVVRDGGVAVSAIGLRAAF